MTMQLEVGRDRYENFNTANCEIQLDALSRMFSFTATMADGVALPFKGGESCKVYIDGFKVLTGSIEVIEVSYDGSDHQIAIQGRSRTANLLDSTLDAISDFRAPITLKQIIEKILAQLSLGIKVIDLVEPEAFSETEDVASPEAGDNAFEFIEKYSRKRQVLLTDDADGNIVIATNSGTNADGAVQHVIDGDDNNVLKSTFSFDISGRYRIYKFASQLNLIALGTAGETDLASVVDQSGGVSDTDIPVGRQLILVSETPYSSDPNIERAKWERDVRRTRGLAYLTSVHGYRVDPTDVNSLLWQTNKLYRIIDDFIGKNEAMLCNSINFSLDLTSGEQTTLGFVDEAAYTLAATKPSTSDIADNII